MPGIEPFTPSMSAATSEQMRKFLMAPISDDLTAVPGIGGVSAEALREAGISTTFALLGKFLTFKAPNMGTVQHVEIFWLWLNDVLQDTKVSVRHKAAAVRAIALKAETMLPGLYNEDIYGADEGHADK